VIRKRIACLAGALGGALVASAACAAQPRPWETGFQPAATPIMSQIEWFDAYTRWFIIPITLLVVGLLVWCMIRFRAGRNPVPSRTAHNTVIEVIWTVGPVIVLLCIAVPSFQLLTAQYNPPQKPTMTIKATGNQWNWDYEYENPKPLKFNSAIILDQKARDQLGKQNMAEYPRLLTVDHELVLPVDTTIRILVTGADVIHSFAVPAFGIKEDAVPGRINETWIKVEKPGMYYGQCSELCGKDHAFMPIAVRVVTKDQFKTWYKAAQADLESANKALMAVVDSKNNVASAAARAGNVVASAD
jgi:cytochrome c oxidase subunit 2